MMKMIAIASVLVATAGCMPAGLSDGSDGGTPTTGIYRVAQVTTGNCQPAAADDGTTASVDADQPGQLRISLNAEWFPAPPSGLAFNRGVQFQAIPGTMVTNHRQICSALLQQTMTVEQAAVDRLRLRRDDAFSDVADPGNRLCGPPELPSADCTQSTEFDYELVEPCAASCIQTDLPADATQPVGFHCGC